MKDNFQRIMASVFEHEGGFVNHKKDPGGATNYGITIGTLGAWRGRRVSVDEVKKLDRAEAAEIYRRNYWEKVRGDALPGGVDCVVMDSAVNSGVSRAVKWLQAAVGSAADGKIGPETLSKASHRRAQDTVQELCRIRMGFLRGLKTWGTFGRGWSRRVAAVEALGIKLALEASGMTRERVRENMNHEADEALARASTENKTAGGAVGLGAGGGVIGDIPTWALAAGAVLLVTVMLNYIGRARHSRVRAEALNALAEET